jgi:hypothetical protein
MRTFNGPVPARIERLPKDKRGYPIPFFVAWQDGKPVFPAMDPAKMKTCMRANLCWICGETLGAYKSFAIGPMCVCNRISAEPPQHVDCSKFAAHNCPFMISPLAKRSMDGEGFEKPGGVMLTRNPGVTAIWVTKSYTVIRDGGKPLWRIGPATSLMFYAKGRLATRAEVDHSIGTGLPLLRRQALLDGPDAAKELERQIGVMGDLLEHFVTWPSMTDVDLPGLMRDEGRPVPKHGSGP